MADFSVTINNSINSWGPAPSNKWGAWNWNAFKWGEGTHDLTTETVKVSSETLSLSQSLSLAADFVISLANSVASAEDLGSEVLRSGSYSYVFPSNVTDGESRSFATWTSGSVASVTWTSGTATSTSWSSAA